MDISIVSVANRIADGYGFEYLTGLAVVNAQVSELAAATGVSNETALRVIGTL